jgi:hypothetical protein
MSIIKFCELNFPKKKEKEKQDDEKKTIEHARFEIVCASLSVSMYIYVVER